MTIPHVPVLAGEAIELLDPQPGQIVVDCTFGAGGHARLLAERIGATGTLIAIDRDPAAAERFAELAAEVSCDDALHPRVVRRRASQQLARRGRRRPTSCCMDLGMSSMQIDTLAARLLLLLRRAAGHAHGSRASSAARTSSSTRPSRATSRRSSASSARSATPARSPARSCASARAEPIGSTVALVDVITDAIPTPARFAGGHPAKRVFQALRIAVNDELGQLDAALPLAWAILRERRPPRRDLLPLARGPARQALPRGAGAGLHLPAGPAGLRLRARARRPSSSAAARSRRPPGEIAANPRARSARLRVASKLKPQEDHG